MTTRLAPPPVVVLETTPSLLKTDLTVCTKKSQDQHATASERQTAEKG
jgi:hypothetical protein